MSSFKEKIMSGRPSLGIWNNIDSSVISEIIGLFDFDWVLLDTEHRPSTTQNLLNQLQSLSNSKTTPIIRVPWLDRVPVKLALDIGVNAVMFPSIDTKEQAEQAVSFMKYAPEGVRGVTGASRACAYGLDFPRYFKDSNDDVLTIIQVETQKAVDNVRDLASVQGVDVVFVGPMDLSTAINKPNRFEDESFVGILRNVAQEVRAQNKIAGIQIPNYGYAKLVKELGYTFIAVSSDTNAFTYGLKTFCQKTREMLNP